MTRRQALLTAGAITAGCVGTKAQERTVSTGLLIKGDFNPPMGLMLDLGHIPVITFTLGVERVEFSGEELFAALKETKCPAVAPPEAEKE